jgi:ParE-like toxin of type II ParDE toxin-antitoxin system
VSARPLRDDSVVSVEGHALNGQGNAMEVRFHRLAAREFREAQKWYESRRTGLSGDFVTEVDRALERITSHPDRWPIYRNRFRRVRLRRFPYSIFYSLERADLILVLAVAHVRRRPDYWLRRGRMT